MGPFNNESFSTYGGKEHEKIVLPKFYNERGENIYMNIITLHIEVKKPN